MDADVVKVCLILAVLGILWVLSGWDTHRRRAVRVGRALHLAEPPPLRPDGAPIEQIAADLRRIRAEILHAAPGMPVARRRGWCEAYDDVLAAACRALDVEERIHAFPEGTARDVERERVERSLARSGIDVRLPA